MRRLNCSMPVREPDVLRVCPRDLGRARVLILRQALLWYLPVAVIVDQAFGARNGALASTSQEPRGAGWMSTLRARRAEQLAHFETEVWSARWWLGTALLTGSAATVSVLIRSGHANLLSSPQAIGWIGVTLGVLTFLWARINTSGGSSHVDVDLVSHATVRLASRWLAELSAVVVCWSSLGAHSLQMLAVIAIFAKRQGRLAALGFVARERVRVAEHRWTTAALAAMWELVLAGASSGDFIAVHFFRNVIAEMCVGGATAVVLPIVFFALPYRTEPLIDQSRIRRMWRLVEARQDVLELVRRGARWDAVAWLEKVPTAEEVADVVGIPGRHAGRQLVDSPPRGARLPADLEPELAGAYWSGFHEQVVDLASRMKSAESDAGGQERRPGRTMHLLNPAGGQQRRGANATGRLPTSGTDDEPTTC